MSSEYWKVLLLKFFPLPYNLGAQAKIHTFSTSLLFLGWAAEASRDPLELYLHTATKLKIMYEMGGYKTRNLEVAGFIQPCCVFYQFAFFINLRGLSTWVFVNLLVLSIFVFYLFACFINLRVLSIYLTSA